MKRSGGVTLVATFSLLGSLFTLLMGIGIGALFALFPIPQPTTPGSPSSKAVLVSLSLLYILPAIWGISTSIGLFRLKQWSRISIIIFSVILLFLGLGSVFSVLVIPAFPPQAVSHEALKTIDWVMAVFAAALTSVGVWWMVFFNRQTIKAQFAPSLASVNAVGQTAAYPDMQAGEPQAKIRPLSITVIAFFLLASSMFMFYGVVTRFPAYLFAKLWTGWPATLIYICFSSANLYLGIGLLRLNGNARRLAIAYFAFALLSSMTFYLAPGAQERTLALMQAQRSIFPATYAQPTFSPEYNSRVLMVGALMSAISMSVPLYFVITRRRAFVDPDTRAALDS
jgi:hypothetical protein